MGSGPILPSPYPPPPFVKVWLSHEKEEQRESEFVRTIWTECLLIWGMAYHVSRNWSSSLLLLSPAPLQSGYTTDICIVKLKIPFQNIMHKLPKFARWEESIIQSDTTQNNKPLGIGISNNCYLGEVAINLSQCVICQSDTHDPLEECSREWTRLFHQRLDTCAQGNVILLKNNVVSDEGTQFT